MPPNFSAGAGKSLLSRAAHSAFFKMGDYSELVSFEFDLATCYEAEYLLSVERHGASLGSIPGSQVGCLFPHQAECQRNHHVAMGVSPHCDNVKNCTLVGPACTENCRELSVFTDSVPSRSLYDSWTPLTEGHDCPCTHNCAALPTAGANVTEQPVCPCQRKRKCASSTYTAQLQGDGTGSNMADFPLWGALMGGVAHARVARTVAVGPVRDAGCEGTCTSLPAAKRHKPGTAMFATGLF